MNTDRVEICRVCANARDKYGGACYCTKYGMTIGYSKTSCRGFEREQVSQQKDDA